MNEPDYYSSLDLGFGSRTGAIAPTNPRSKTFAQDMNAYLARQQWDDYQRRFQPVETQLIDETLSRELLDKRLSGISGIVDRSFETAFGNAAMTRARYGAQQSAQESQSEQRRADLGRTAAIADARNTTRTHIFDRNMETLAGGSSAVGQAIR